MKIELTDDLANKLNVLLTRAVSFTQLPEGDRYMAEWSDIKDSLNCRIYDENKEVSRQVYDVRDTAAGTRSYESTLWAIELPYGSNEIKSKLKKLQKLAKDIADTGNSYAPLVDSLIAHYTRPGYAEIISDFLAVKGTCQKGRKPMRDEDRKTAPRTLDNTGTCTWCGKNVKLEGDGLYHHGFVITWQARNGACAGQNYPPAEVSDAGYKALLEVLLARIEMLSTNLTKVYTFGDTRYPTHTAHVMPRSRSLR
jgi:hypothetical protein